MILNLDLRKGPPAKRLACSFSEVDWQHEERPTKKTEELDGTESTRSHRQ